MMSVALECGVDLLLGAVSRGLAAGTAMFSLDLVLQTAYNSLTVLIRKLGVSKAKQGDFLVSYMPLAMCYGQKRHKSTSPTTLQW